MMEKLADYLQSIRSGLKDMPPGSVDQVLDYYEEYINDALEAGLSENDVMTKMGNPAEIISTIRTEMLINSIEKKPGPVGLVRASEKVLGNFAYSAAKVSLFVGAIIPFSVAVLLYVLSVVTFISAFAATILVFYGTLQIPVIYLAEKIGTFGLVFTVAALLTSMGAGCWYLANIITRITMRGLRRVMKQTQDIPGKALPEISKIKNVSMLDFNSKRWLLILTAAGLLGAGLLFASGLPLRYFSIWNSMKPINLIYLQKEYKPQNIKDIQITTLNSAIEIQENKADRLIITYEQPDWMSGLIEIKGNTLVFRERSNGRLPFMDFISIHEGMTAVKIQVPKGYLFRNISLETTGGHIKTDILAKNIRAHTFNGNIGFKSINRKYTIKAAAPKGMVYMEGILLAGKSIVDGKKGNHSAILESENGKIEIDSMK